MTDGLIGWGGVRQMVLNDGQWLFFHTIISFSYMIKERMEFYNIKMDEIVYSSSLST